MMRLWTNNAKIARELNTNGVVSICGRTFHGAYEVVEFFRDFDRGQYIVVEMENGKQFQFRYNGALYDVELHSAVIRSTNSEWHFW